MLDRLRALRVGELMRDGYGPPEAMWVVMTDPKLGYRKWRGHDGPRKPCDRSLTRRLYRLLKRGAPDLVEEARDAARVILSAGAIQAASRLVLIAEGDHDRRIPAARLQAIASTKILEAIGVLGPELAKPDREQAGSGTDPDQHRLALEEAAQLIEGTDFVVTTAD